MGISSVGSGRKLIGAAGTAADGLAVSVNGGALGSRGTVSHAKGYASQFNDLINSFLFSDGSLTTHTNDVNASITSLKKQEDDLNVRLAAGETALRAQFTALDTQISTMNSTSTYLTQELAQVQVNS